MVLKTIRGVERVVIQGRYGYATNTDMLGFFGVKRWPVDGLPERMIDGLRVYVRPQIPLTDKQRKRAAHRVIAICRCGQHVPTGRLHQHKCKGQ